MLKMKNRACLHSVYPRQGDGLDGTVDDGGFAVCRYAHTHKRSSNPLPFANGVSCFHCHSRAGNWLKIIEWFRNWNRVSIVHKFAMILSVIGMSFATLQFTPVLALMVISKVPSSVLNPSDGNHVHE